MHLPRTARDIMKLSARDWLIYNSVIAFFRLTGRWQYPVPTIGDYEFMSRMDLIYWLYKSQFPVQKAIRGAGLEDFFRQQEPIPCDLPCNFTVDARIEMSAVGDLMSHPFLSKSESLYASVADLIFGPDICMANLECVVLQGYADIFTFDPSRSSPPLHYDLASFNTVSGVGYRNYTFMTTANNHTLDFGEEGVHSTIQALESRNIAFGGTNQSKENSYAATILESNGIKVGLVCHTFGLNGRTPPPDKPWLVNRTSLLLKAAEIDFTQVLQQVQYCQKRQVDLIVAQVHWGLEHEYYPRPEQIEVAHQLAEMGLDVIIGHHPHVIQPMEYYRTRRDPARIVPIFYSLGNLITPFSDPRFRKSAVARIKLSKGSLGDGKIRCFVEEARMHEVFLEISGDKQELRLVRCEETPAGSLHHRGKAETQAW